MKVNGTRTLVKWAFTELMAAQRGVGLCMKLFG